jgi:hypothetical protein
MLRVVSEALASVSEVGIQKSQMTKQLATTSKETMASKKHADEAAGRRARSFLFFLSTSFCCLTTCNQEPIFTPEQFQR